MSHIKKNQQHGFAALELLLVVVMVVAVTGVGYYVLKQRKAASNKSVASQSTKTITAPNGTAAAVQQILDQGAQNEQNADTKGATNTANTTNSTNTTVGAIGGSYNENSF